MAAAEEKRYQITPTNGQPPFEINQAQWDALNRKFLQSPDGSQNFVEFRRRACLGFGGTLMIHWCGMWLGIEPDGHTHS